MKLPKSIISASAVAIFLSLTVSAPVQADGAKLYATKTCFGCHGKDAKTPLLPIYPKLAGQSADYAYNQMQDIKSGARSNGNTAAMKGIMGLVNDAEMREIANWLATQ
ncbi:MAG: cytochrome c [Gammaproteobacteria bacterium]|nr:cytochrome c [Gammaproteobacteria bacterium]